MGLDGARNASSPIFNCDSTHFQLRLDAFFAPSSPIFHPLHRYFLRGYQEKGQTSCSLVNVSLSPITLDAATLGCRQFYINIIVFQAYLIVSGTR